MKKNDIDKKLQHILEKYVAREKIETLWETGQNRLLTGEPWGVSAIDMTYIFLEVEKVFRINIDTGSILNYEFGTIAGIKRCICKVTNEKRYNIAAV